MVVIFFNHSSFKNLKWITKQELYVSYKVCLVINNVHSFGISIHANKQNISKRHPI